MGGLPKTEKYTNIHAIYIYTHKQATFTAIQSNETQIIPIKKTKSQDHINIYIYSFNIEIYINKQYISSITSIQSSPGTVRAMMAATEPEGTTGVSEKSSSSVVAWRRSLSDQPSRCGLRGSTRYGKHMGKNTWDKWCQCSRGMVIIDGSIQKHRCLLAMFIPYHLS